MSHAELPPPSLPYVIRINGVAGAVHVTAAGAAAGDYLKSYDPEAHDGHGDLVTTPELAEARRFDGFRSAWETWQAVPAARPLRDDGQPNRPLTAFTVSIEPVEVAR
jgi:hypothetical protein